MQLYNVTVTTPGVKWTLEKLPAQRISEEILFFAEHGLKEAVITPIEEPPPPTKKA